MHKYHKLITKNIFICGFEVQKLWPWSRGLALALKVVALNVVTLALKNRGFGFGIERLCFGFVTAPASN